MSVRAKTKQRPKYAARKSGAATAKGRKRPSHRALRPKSATTIKRETAISKPVVRRQAKAAPIENAAELRPAPDNFDTCQPPDGKTKIPASDLN